MYAILINLLQVVDVGTKLTYLKYFLILVLPYYCYISIIYFKKSAN